MTDLISVTVDDGKYTVRQAAWGKWEFLRYGEPWSPLAGDPDNVHVALATEIHELLEKLAYWTRGTEVIEACLAKAVKADPLDAPMPLVGVEAQRWHAFQAEAYRHALEMMGVPQDFGPKKVSGA